MPATAKFHAGAIDSCHGYNAAMQIKAPFNLRGWVEDHRALLRPPVGNKLLFEDGGFIVMAVGGPNARKDFHHDPGEELFFQLEGDILLKTVQDGRVTDVHIREGDLFLLPAEIPHSPQRPAGSVGLVVERRREPDELDGFSWYCEKCGHCLYLERVAVQHLGTQLPGIFERFYADVRLRTCSICGAVMQPP
jgi:3-hydroxyanthranilate 3,4-dioxygenase